MTTSPRKTSRRSFLRGAALTSAGLAGAYALGCSSGDNDAGPGDGGTPADGPLPTVTPIPEAPSLRWQELSPPGALPPPRRDHSLVLSPADGLLYVYGGHDSDGELGDLWQFDVGAEEWTELSPEGPAARFGHNAFFDEPTGRMYVFGGQAGSDFFNDLWSYDPAAESWTELSPEGPLPEARYGAAGARRPSPANLSTSETPGPESAVADPLPGQILVSHGFTHSGRFADTWQFDIESGVWSEVTPEDEPPEARCLLRGVWDTVRRRMVIYGGQAVSSPFLDDLWTLSDKGWTPLTRVPNGGPRNLYAMAFAHQRLQLLIFGGNTPAGPANDVWQFDAVDEFWRQDQIVNEPPSPRFSHDGVWIEESEMFLFFGGFDGAADLNDLWTLAATS